MRAVALSLIIGALLSAGGVGGCAHALCDAEASGWHAVKTPHFVIHTPTFEVRYGYLADRLERMYSAYAASPLFGPVDARDIDVVLFDDYTEFIDHFGYNRAAMIVHDAGASGRHDGVLFFGIDSPQSEMAHALAHRLLRAGGRRLPPWYEEGMAVYAETVVVLEGVVRFGLPSPKIAEAHLGRLVTFGELFAATWNDFDGDRRGHYRNAAEELVRILLSGDGEGLPRGFAAFQAALFAGATSEAALAAAWPDRTPDQIHDALDAYVRRSKYPDFVGYRTPGSILMGMTVTDEAPVDLKALCAACRRLSDEQREGWPDWSPPLASPAAAAAK